MLGEFMLLQQTYFNNQALNEVILLNRMVQIHHDMGWDIPMENFDPEDEDQPEAEALIDQAEDIHKAAPMDIFIDDGI